MVIFLVTMVVEVAVIIVQIPLLLKERKKGYVLFNDTLNTFFLQLFGQVKDYSDSER